MKNLNNAVLTICLCLLVLCMQPVGDGNGSHTGNPVVSGRLFASDGTPAAGAVVRFIPISQTMMPGTHKTAVAEYTCVTDENGIYGFDSLPDTLYNIFGEGDRDMSFRDSVKVKKRDSTHIPADTLKAPGSMYGIVRLQPEHSSRTVILLLPGTNTFVIPGDSIGHFAITRMARGTYPVRIITTLDDYNPKDTFFTVRCGMSDTLKDTLRLEYTGIPVVTGITATLDSVRIFVTVRWNRIDTALIAGYNVYRGNVDSTFGSAPINKTLVKDTVFVDEELVRRQGQRMVYKVKAVNGNGDGSKTFSMGTEIKISGAYCVAESIPLPGHATAIVTNASGDIFSLVYTSSGLQQLMRINAVTNIPEEFQIRDSMGNPLDVNVNGQLLIDSKSNLYNYVWNYLGKVNEFLKIDSSGILIDSIITISDTIAILDCAISTDDLIYLLIQDENVNIRTFNTNGDSLANWRIQESAGTTPFCRIFHSMAACDSFVAIKSNTEIKIIDRFTGAVQKQLPARWWFNYIDAATYWMDNLAPAHNGFYYLNEAQNRAYNISREGSVLSTIEDDPETAQYQFLGNDATAMTIGKNQELIISGYETKKILKYDRKP